MYAVHRAGTPATVLKWLAGLGVTSQGLSFTRSVIYTALGVSINPFDGANPAMLSPQQADLYRKIAPYAEYIDGTILLVGLIGVVMGAIIFFGAGQMKKLESLGLARLAAVLAIIPCTSPCCAFIGVPVGIWALVVLSDPRVVAEFGS